MRKSTLVLSGAIVLALVLVAGKFFVTSDSFGLTNPSWNGASSIGMDDRMVPVYGLGQLRQASPGDTLLIIGPSVDYSEQDARDVSYFMLNGGRAIVMDDYGTADTLLAKLGSPVEIIHEPLCQDVDYYRSPSLPIVTGIVYHEITGNVSSLAFNHPVPLELSGDATPLAGTTPRGWLDTDDNSTLDGNESFGSYTLVAQARYGKGELIVAGDADLFINSMLRKGDNGVLLDNIMKGGTVYVDAGHGLQVPPLASLYYLLKYNFVAQVLCVITVLALACAYTLRSKPRGKIAEQGKDLADPRRSLIAAMRERMPLTDREINEMRKKL